MTSSSEVFLLFGGGGWLGGTIIRLLKEQNANLHIANIST
jgi:CRISPR/Cas system CSM-associated protein Csm5 (group 7 of RAMP superfamily)